LRAAQTLQVPRQGQAGLDRDGAASADPGKRAQVWRKSVQVAQMQRKCCTGGAGTAHVFLCRFWRDGQVAQEAQALLSPRRARVFLPCRQNKKNVYMITQLSGRILRS
jgi:hypothetical protein